LRNAYIDYYTIIIMTAKNAKGVNLYEKELKKQKSIEQKLRDEAGEFKKQLADKLLKLVTSGFGLVAALAWNELIKEVIKVYVEPIFGKGSGLVSLLIYAMVVTLLAVVVTYQLSKIVGEKKED
jgi:ABC-type uncharacterized transport system fused permease/ATPase subunit